VNKNKGGRPSKYHTHVEPRLIEIEGWARDGLTDEQIAYNLGVAYSTFKEYKKKYPDLMATLKKGKEVVDREVENALLKRALGYEYTEEKIEISDDGRKIIQTTKHVPGDTTAQIFWLKNRKPNEWRDKRDVDIKGNMEINNPFAGLTTEELKKLVHND